MEVINEMCEVDFYTYCLLVVTILLGFFTLGCFRCAYDEYNRKPYYFLNLLDSEQIKLLKNLEIKLVVSEKENLESIDKFIALIENAANITLPPVLLTII